MSLTVTWLARCSIEIDLGTRQFPLSQEVSGLEAAQQEVFLFWQAHAKPGIATYFVSGHGPNALGLNRFGRSEERRVGKEC